MAWLETRVPPVVWFGLAAALQWVIARSEIDGLPLDHVLFNVAGISLMLAGVLIGGLGVGSFGRARTTVNPHSIDRASALVATGIYRFTRNPMYLGLVAVLAGWGLLLGSPLSLIVGCGLFLAVLTRVQIMPEERVLTRLFGVDYAAYRSQVRRWL